MTEENGNFFKKIGWRKILSASFWTLVLILLGIFILRTLIWENQYYSEKVGAPRETATSSTEDTAVDETAPTETEISEYTVATDRPRYLSISYLGISNARVVAVSVNSDGALGTPNNIFDVGWYDNSDKPGEGRTMLIDGHNGGPNVYGVFKRIPLLCAKDDTSTRSIETGESRTCTGGAGDEIIIERGDGQIFTYEVIDNVTVSLSQADDYMASAMVSPISGVESVSLITCTGEWSSSQKTYLSRQFLRAVLKE